MPINKKWVLSRENQCGTLTEDDFKLEEEQMSDITQGEVLVKALFFSVDPIIRLYMDYGMEQGSIIPGRQVGRVVDSRHKVFSKGKLVCGSMGWQTYSILQPDQYQEMCGRQVKLIEELPKQTESLSSVSLPKSTCLGVLGIPGLSAYFALCQVCKAKAGETIVISSAAGQIGHLAGQIAKILGLNVIGYTGDGEKASWIKMGLGFDWAFNYKTQDLSQTLKIAAPGGVDIFLDSVGGTMYNQILVNHMNFGGRICIFGNLSLYNVPCQPEPVQPTDLLIAIKGLCICGFNVYNFLDQFEAGRDQLAAWCKEGKLRPYEHVVEGFENLPRAFIDQIEGRSQGKVIVRMG